MSDDGGDGAMLAIWQTVRTDGDPHGRIDVTMRSGEDPGRRQ